MDLRGAEGQRTLPTSSHNADEGTFDVVSHYRTVHEERLVFVRLGRDLDHQKTQLIPQIDLVDPQPFDCGYTR